ncbi:hypothetical protein [Yoonia sp. SS1-5]|uniref:Uncharacterized protein n=1 Tax=Yoonia rhodophyticola TaxID=3137370 RepID=A0AAN0NJ33_9RHOB
MNWTNLNPDIISFGTFVAIIYLAISGSLGNVLWSVTLVRGLVSVLRDREADQTSKPATRSQAIQNDRRQSLALILLGAVIVGLFLAGTAFYVASGTPFELAVGMGMGIALVPLAYFFAIAATLLGGIVIALMTALVCMRIARQLGRTEIGSNRKR